MESYSAVWRSYQIAQDHKCVTKLSRNVGYCRRTARKYCGIKMGWEGEELISPESDSPHFYLRTFTATACHQPATEDTPPFLQDKLRPHCYLSLLFQSTWGSRPSHFPFATAQCLAKLQQQWQERCLACFTIPVINLWLRRHEAESSFIF